MFYQIGTIYKHMGYSDDWKCITFTSTHAVLKSEQSGRLHSVPHHKQHLWMYKKIKHKLSWREVIQSL